MTQPGLIGNISLTAAPPNSSARGDLRQALIFRLMLNDTDDPHRAPPVRHLHRA